MCVCVCVYFDSVVSAARSHSRHRMQVVLVHHIEAAGFALNNVARNVYMCACGGLLSISLSLGCDARRRRRGQPSGLEITGEDNLFLSLSLFLS